METKTVRTRFAPSPTGFMHVGNARSALFPWLIARKYGGKFILRLEDTDQNRLVEGASEHIMETLRWLGLTWDEGPDIGGEFSPYVQSLRKETYHKWAHELIKKGFAYADPYTPEQLEEFRKAAEAERKPFLYRNHRPDNPPTWDGTQALRFRVSDIGMSFWHDEVMGDLSAGPEALDDFILIKADGLPTYNFAHIIDDYEMKITHVIRGLEYISSTPKYLALYKALGFDVPVLASLPHILAPDGKKKLGKRDGAQDVLEYRNAGYQPEVMINFLASMGWNDGTTKEIYTASELISAFDLSRVQRSGARFDEQRLEWMNGAFIRSLSISELSDRVSDYWHPAGVMFPAEYKEKVLKLNQDRLKKFDELSELTWFFFKDPTPSPELHQLISEETNLSDQIAVEYLETVSKTIENTPFTEESLHDATYGLCEPLKTKPAILFKLIRISLVGGKNAPGLFETMEVLGKETVLRRLANIRSIFTA